MLLDWLVSFSMAFSGQAVITFAAVRMLYCKRPGIIWAIAILGCMVTAYVNSAAVPADVQALWSVVNLAISIITYVAFSGLRPLKALFVVACIMLTTLLAEFAVVLVTLYCFDSNVTAGPAYAYRHPEAYLFLIVFHSVVLGLLLYVAHTLTRRLTVGKGDGEERKPMRALLFPVSQSALLLMGIIVVRVIAPQDEGALLYGALLTLAVLGAYLVFYVAMRKVRAQELVDARIEAMQAESQLTYERVRAVALQSSHMSKLRHDFRNQMQVIEWLCERGEVDEAMRLIDDLLEKVEREAAR